MMDEVEILPISSDRIRFLLAVVRLHESGVRLTIRKIADDQHCSLNKAHLWLRSLRDDGLVAFEDHHIATLRPLVGTVR